MVLEHRTCGHSRGELRADQECEIDRIPENVECQTCGGTGCRQVDQHGQVWGDKLADAMSTIIVGDIPCPDCTQNVETS